jgi:phosphoenolpyruvate phosphomutase
MGAHDGLSARIANREGFDGIWASGLEISASYAVPDANILTMTQFLERAIEMNESTNIPVVADVDTGYGNSNNAMHTVRSYEAAGIAAVCVEDKLFPKVNSFIPGRQELAPVSEFVGKIMACKSAQRDPDFMVIARVEALIAGHGEREALRRAHAYIDGGADAILIHSKEKTPNEIVSFAKAWDKRAPLVVVPTTYPSFDISTADKLGIKMVIYANHGLRASIKAMRDVFKEIKEAHGLSTVDPMLVPLSDVFDLQGMYQMKQNESQYLKGKHDDISVIIPAAGDPGYEPSIKPVVEDRPIAMLDINGKPVLRRNVETLKEVGLKNVQVVTGYKSEMFNVNDVNYVHNVDYASNGPFNSILLAAETIKDRVIVAFSDILFDSEVIGRILQEQDDIVLVVDKTLPKKTVNTDYVFAKDMPSVGGRSMNRGSLGTITCCQKDEDGLGELYEFVGIFSCSKVGFELLKQAFNKLQHDQQESGNVHILQIFQKVLDAGNAIHALPVRQGWMEIRDIEDYKIAHQFFNA